MTMDKIQKAKIIPKLSVVHVDRKTRGRFPGEKAPAGTTGLVWTSWFGAGFGTHKISLITTDLKLYFTTASCVSVLGFSDSVEGFNTVRSEWASKHFIPIVLQVVDVKISAPVKKGKSLNDTVEENKQYVRYQTLNKKSIYVKKAYCHPDDWSSLMTGIEKGERAFCIRLEPWILEKAEII